MKLYTTRLSANGRKPLAVAAHLGIALEVVPVNVYAGEGQAASYLAINPRGKVPTLVEGDWVLWESNAIAQYLDDRCGRALSPTDPKARATMTRWLFWEAAHWQPAWTRAAAPRVAQILLSSDSPACEVDWDSLAAELAPLDAHLRGHEYLVGELSLADFVVGGMMTYARATQLPFERYPHLRGWYERLEALPAWQATAHDTWRAHD